MQNIKAKLEGNKLILEIDVNEELEATTGGKGIVIAKTGGYIPLSNEPGSAKISLHMWKPRKKEEKVKKTLF